MKRRALLLASLPLAAAAQIARPPAPHTGRLLFTGATLHRVSGPPLVRGQLLVVDGRIAAIAPEGEALNAAGPVTRVALDGLQLYPGLVAANTQLGLVEVPTVRGTVDVQEGGALNPNAHALVAFNADSELIAVTRAEGVLAAEVAPVSPRGGLLAGRSGVLQLDGWAWPDMALRGEHALHLHLPPSRAQADFFSGGDGNAPPRNVVQERLRQLDELLAQGRAYAQARAADPKLLRDLRLEALAPYASGNAPVFVHAQELAQLRQALALQQRHGLRMVLVAGPDVVQISALLKARDIPVIVDGVQELPLRRDDAIDASESVPARLHEAGVRFAIARQGGARNAPNTRNLAHEAAAAVAHGLPPEAALRAITLSAAELLGVADLLGSLEVGKLASFFVCDGNALEVSTRVQRIWVRGREIDVRNRQTRLMEKYGSR
ncbi:MAG: amidohydrolase family protein [Burkholderiales bacterium]